MNELVRVLFHKKVFFMYVLVSIIETLLLVYSRKSFGVVEKGLEHLVLSSTNVISLGNFLASHLSEIIFSFTVAYLISMLYWTYFSFIKTYVYFLYSKRLRELRFNFWKILARTIKFYGFWNTLVYGLSVGQAVLVAFSLSTLNPLLLVITLVTLIVNQAIVIWSFILKLNSSVLVGTEEIGILDVTSIENFSSGRLIALDIAYLLTFLILESYQINELITYLIILLMNILTAYYLVNEYINYRKKLAQSS